MDFATAVHTVHCFSNNFCFGNDNTYAQEAQLLLR